MLLLQKAVVSDEECIFHIFQVITVIYPTWRIWRWMRLLNILSGITRTIRWMSWPGFKWGSQLITDRPQQMVPNAIPAVVHSRWCVGNLHICLDYPRRRRGIRRRRQRNENIWLLIHEDERWGWILSRGKIPAMNPREREHEISKGWRKERTMMIH